MLYWIRGELGFNSLDSFASCIASAPRSNATGEKKTALEYDIDYAKDKMKLWRKSSCNCSCAWSAECKHRGISSESIALVSERLKTAELCITGTDVTGLLVHAKMLDNLQASFILKAAKIKNEHIGKALMKDEFRCNVERFHTYIDRYGI